MILCSGTGSFYPQAYEGFHKHHLYPDKVVLGDALSDSIQYLIFAKKDVYHNIWLNIAYPNLNLGKDPATKSDEFLGKCQRGGEGYFQSKNLRFRFWEL